MTTPGAADSSAAATGRWSGRAAGRTRAAAGKRRTDRLFVVRLDDRRARQGYPRLSTAIRNRCRHGRHYGRVASGIEQLLPLGNRDRDLFNRSWTGERRKLVGYLNPVVATLLMMNRWKIKTMMTIGMVVKKEPTSTQLVLQRIHARSWRAPAAASHKPKRSAPGAPEEVIPLTLEAEDGERVTAGVERGKMTVRRLSTCLRRQ